MRASLKLPYEPEYGSVTPARCVLLEFNVVSPRCRARLASHLAPTQRLRHRIEMTAIYRGMDRATLDAAYDNTGAVADSQDYRAHWWEASAAIRAQPQSKLDVRYGARPRAALDYFPSGATHAPLFVFIHGGYWQRNEKERFSFIVPGPRAHGINVAIPGYTLAPDARLTDIVAEIRQALTFLVDCAGELGFDRRNIYIGGWSAGGHLATVVVEHPAVRGAIPISGIFDLEPIALGVLNEKLQLSTEEIAKLSPLRNLAQGSPPLSLFVGAAELPELKLQSEDYAKAARGRELPVTLTILPNHHHFSILDELARSDGTLVEALRDLIKLAG
jgi:arylformamidase